MKILLKILLTPFALALSLLAALLVFLFDICAVLLTVVSVILAVLGIALLFTPMPIGGIVFLLLALLWKSVLSNEHRRKFWNVLYIESCKGIKAGENWKIRINLTHRNGLVVTAQEFALIITIRDAQGHDIYSEVVNGLRERGYITNNLETRQQIRQRQ